MPRRGLPDSMSMRHDEHYVEALAASAGAPVGRMVPIDLIDPNPNQPRQVMGDLSELIASISEKGIIEPLVVRQRGERLRALSDRLGGQRLMTAGLGFQAAGLLWIAAVSTPTIPYADLVAPFALSGFGMALFFAPVANVVLSSVRPEQEGKASGATNAIRELGSIFAHVGGYQSGIAFVHGTTTAVYVGGALVALGAVAAALIPGRPRRSEAVEQLPEAVLDAA